MGALCERLLHGLGGSTEFADGEGGAEHQGGSEEVQEWRLPHEPKRRPSCASGDGRQGERNHEPECELFPVTTGRSSPETPLRGPAHPNHGMSCRWELTQSPLDDDGTSEDHQSRTE